MGSEMGNQNSNGLHVSEEDIAQATTGLYNSESLILSNDVQDQKALADNAADSLQGSKEHDMKDAANGSSKAMLVSKVAYGVEGLIVKKKANDVEGESQEASPPVESEDLPKKQSSPNDHSAIDDNLVEKSTSKRREEGENVLNTSSNTKPIRIAHYDTSAEGTGDHQISKVDGILASRGKGDELEDTKLGRPNQSAAANSNSNSEIHFQDLSITESESSEDKVLMNSFVVKETKEDNGNQQPGSDIIGGDYTRGEHDTLTDRVNFTYLKTIDSEIKRLILEDDHKALEKACNTGINKISEVKQREDVQTEIIETKHEDSGSYQKENQRREIGSKFQDSGLEKAIENGERNEAEIGCEKQDSQYKEKMECVRELSNEKEGLENEERLMALTTSSIDLIGSESQRMQVEPEDLNAKETTTKEKTELISGNLGDQSEEVRAATVSEENLSQKASVQSPASPDQYELKKNLSQPHHPSQDFFQESEQKHTSLETETLANKEEEITDSDQLISILTNVSDPFNICKEVSSITENISTSPDEVESKQNMQDETARGLLVDSSEQPHEEEEKSVPADLVISSAKVGALEAGGRFNTGSIQENPCVESYNTSMIGFNIEQSIVATEASGPKAQKEECEQSSPLHLPESVKHLIYESGSGHETQESSSSNKREVKIEKSPQNPSLVAEALLSTVESSHEESDMSLLLNQTKSGDNEFSALETSNSGKLKTPLLFKPEVHDVEPLEAQEGLLLKKNVKDVWNSPAKKIVEAPLRDKEKQKPRYSLFGNCMCCTTAIN